MSREHTGYSKHSANNTREDATYGRHHMVNTEIRLIIFFAAKDGEALYSQQKQDQELTGPDHEHLIAKFRLKFKKVGKTTRPFRYYLNQNYYNGSDKQIQGIISDRVPEELWTEVCDTVQETEIKIIPKKKNAKRQNGCLRKPYK